MSICRRELDLTTIVAVQARTKVYVMSHGELGRVCIKESPDELLSVAQHELAVLKQLAGVDGVPTAFALVRDESESDKDEGSAMGASPSQNSSFLLTSFFKAAPLHKLFYQHKEFPVSTAATVFFHLAKILQQVHLRGIVHNDIKLPNILLSANRDPLVALVDFGSAARLIESSHSDSTKKQLVLPPAEGCSTMHTRAPETFRSFQEEDNPFARDFWSFGVCLFECVAGISPFGGFNVKSCDVADVASAICWPPKYSKSGGADDGFRELISGLLRPEPSQRLCSWEVLLEARFFTLRRNEIPEDYEEEVEMQTLGL